LIGSQGGKKLVVLAATVGALLAPTAAEAAIPNALGVPCTVQGDGVRFCTDTPRSTVPAWDGVPIDVNVAFPPEPAAGVDGNFPLVMMFHGYGGGKIGLNGMQRWLDRGYATFSMTTRGFRESCGSAASKTAGGAACNNGYVRLIDNRYEVRDAQEFAGRLADQGAGLIDPQKIGAIGGSYGGGMSMALGALKNRKVMPDYSLVPWTSPAGKPMQIAAAAPNIPWTDLAYSLVPNGSTLDYVADAPYRGAPGVSKQSLVEGLYLSGLGAPGFYAPVGTDPTADLIGWKNRLDLGEPYGADVQSILTEIQQHHSSYYIDHSIQPAPMLMSSGFTDDLFPADETIRFYNRTRTQYPDADLNLFFGDFGHPRSQNQKTGTTDALRAEENAWFDFYIKGVGTEPASGATAYTQTCPGNAPAAGPFTAGNWASIAPGEIRYRSDDQQTIAPDSNTAAAFNPVGNNACTTTTAADRPGDASYELDPAPAGGYTLLGAVTVIAQYGVSTDTSQVAARLLDVAPDGTETLVNRGLWRPQGGDNKEVFQLHPNGWNFAEGHKPKLELFASDSSGAPIPALANYGRPSNGQGPITVENLKMRMPVLEKPGSFGGLVGSPAPKVVQEGYELAADFKALAKPKAAVKGKLKVNGKKAVAKVTCPAEFVACNDGTLVANATKGGKFKAASGTFGSIAGGTTKSVKLKLTGKARKKLAKKPKLKVRTELTIAEVANSVKGKTTLAG